MQGKLILTEVDRDLLDELLGMRVVQAVEADRYWQARFTVTCNWVDLPYIHRILARVGEREPAAQPVRPTPEAQPVHSVLAVGTNNGHGHVWPRPDGVKVRCGGPGLCRECSHDQALLRDAGKDGPER